MKKVLPSLALIGILVIPMIVSAQIGQPEIAEELAICCGPGSILYNVTNWLFTILLVIAAIFIIIAAYMFVTASGDPDKTKTARNFVLYALIGVLVAFGARGLVWLVERIAEG